MKPAAAIAAGVAVLVLASAAWWGWARLADGDSAAAARKFVTPERKTVAATVLATGILRVRVGGEVRVGAQLSGIVEKLNVVVGSKINKRDVLATIDARGLESRLAQARAQVGVLEQELKRAEVELARSERLGQQRLIARTDVEDRELALAEARAKLEKARRDAAVVETDLKYAVIRSPITGTVASVSTQEGETVAASFNTPTFATIIEDGALELIALVDETDIGNVALGNPVTFTVEAYPAREFAGRVERIAPRGTIISGVVNFEVMIRIESPVELLKPDMTANVSIRTAEREALVLPSAAILKDDTGRYVWVEKDGKLQRQTVTAGTREAGSTEIRQGVITGDRVLLSPMPPLPGGNTGVDMIELEHVTKTYLRDDGTPVAALRDISCRIAVGEFVTVRGASGSGKSSLLNILGCLDTPTSGIYRLAGEDVSGYTDRERSAIRARRIGFVFQSFNLLARTTAVENVEVPALYSGGEVDRAKALALLKRVGLAERSGHFVTELSGGEQQRVAIARALMNDPPLLLADEPTGNLDSAVGDSIMELLTELNGEGRTIVLVTHDERVASYAARELLLRDGIIASDRAQGPRPGVVATGAKHVVG